MVIVDAARAGLESLGPSPAMRELQAAIVTVAREGRDVVLRGEPGTGRRWVARTIHCLARRDSGSWVEADARSLESGDVPTLLAAARVGTLVLRELAAAGDAVRAAAATAAREGGRGRALLVATVADAPMDPAALLAEDARSLRLPPLRERARDDVAAVLASLHRALRADLGLGPSELEDAARERLLGHAWSGNIREMRNALERALLVAGTAPTVTVEHLAADFRHPDAGARAATLAEVERTHIERTVRRHGGNRTRAARELGISRATLINKIRSYALDV